MTSSKGFTLIEILVVLFIMSIVTSVALLSISHNENRQLEAFASEFVQTMTLAEEQAMLQASVLGVSIKSNKLQFASYPSLQPVQDKLFSNHVIPAGMELRFEMSGEKIMISTNGDITPFKLYVGKKGKSPRYVVNGDGDGNITSKLLT